MAPTDTPRGSLERTPTWALATVCFVFISISIVLEHLVHLLTNWLRRRRKSALVDAVDRLRSDLMLLGFMSLLLAVIQDLISKICVPARVARTMLPCRKNIDRILAESSNNSAQDAADSCRAKGKVSLISIDGLQQLQMLIFVLAAMQIVYGVLTMALARAKMRSWKAWEEETQTIEYQVENDPNRFRFTSQTSFGRRHTTFCTETSAHLWIKCFFRQFFNSVAKVDYFTLRHGFISAHLSTRNINFNFQKYIERSLDEDFKVVVSISPLMWFVVVILILVDVHGWNVFLWISSIPLLLVLVVGTKLEVIVARMALNCCDGKTVIIGAPLVEPHNKLFWFGRPKLVLYLVHFILFVNAFELAFFVWVVIEFGWDSCFHEQTVFPVTRIVLAVTVQVLCSYITLPLYALVTQMGSEYKSKIFEEQVGCIIKKWHSEVRERKKKQLEQSFQFSPRTSPALSKEWSFPTGNNLARPTLRDIIYSPSNGEITQIVEENVQAGRVKI